MYKYDISVIIPVYNNEKYIEECVESIVHQEYDLNKIQIILINDGSNDNSLKICENLAKKYKQILLINQKNQGVSIARNNGIKAAEGKYIMFLDSDDFISENAIKELIEFFDKHYEEVDLVAYPLYNYYNDTKKIKKLKRYSLLFDDTRIYDLQKEYYAIQPTVNIVIKNRRENNQLFDTNIFFHEDIKYNVGILYEKRKIGYVDSAKYYYRKYGNSTTNIKDNPLYTFEQYTSIFNDLLDTYKDENGKSLKYVQAVLLNTLRWRLEQDKLYPYAMDRHKALDIIKSLFRKIDNDVIINDKQMNKYHKMYLIGLKEEEKYIYDNNNYQNAIFSINDKNNILLIEDTIEVVLNRFKVINSKINILGYLKSPLLQYCESELYVEYINNDNKTLEEKIELSDSNASHFRTNIKVANFKKFELQVDIHKIKNFKFKVLINKKMLPITFFFNKWVPFNEKIENNKIYANGYKIQFENDEFQIIKATTGMKIKDFILDINRYAKIDNKINIYRTLALITRRKNKKIWLYYDRVGVIDNAYYQFKNDINKKDNIKKYYVWDGNLEEAKSKFSKKEMKNVIKYGSYKHKLLYLNSDKILTAFSSIQEYCPLHKRFRFYKDILKYQLVYLQHGILHAHLLKMYSKEFAPIDKFVVSTEFEKNNLINKYNYSENDLIPVGMPRLDEGNKAGEAKNKIIYAPSWREYLIGKAVDRKRAININKFVKSKYYIQIMKFLTDQKLNEVLKKQNMKLEFKIHPIFTDYKECFKKAENDNISVSIGQVNLDEYKVFITDFSSYQFDFVKLERPLIYFVPDMDEFKSGLHSYREIDLPYEDAFGKLCLTGEELVDELIEVINRDCIASPKYKERMEKFFYKVDNRKDKLYEALKKDS